MSYQTEIANWHEARLAALTAPDGWLNLVGRQWLETGTASIGAGADNDLVIGAGPDQLGSVTLAEDGGVTLAPAAGGPVLDFPASGMSQKQTLGDLLIEIHQLNGRRAIRIRDLAIDTAAQLPGIDQFPVDPAWRVVARWVALDTPLDLEIDTVVGVRTRVAVTHRAAFEHDSKTFSMLATHGSRHRPMFVFRDLTSGHQTYGAARFLYGEESTDDTVVLDFNKAINPPCAFTPHAVCPLPPDENRLAVRIEAGELTPG